MSWRDLEGRRIEQVLTADRQEAVLRLEDGRLAQVRAEAQEAVCECGAELRVEILRVEKDPPEAGQSGLVKDPVCLMAIDPRNAAATSEYEGRTYYFCAVGCKHEFDRDPSKYAKKDGARRA
jgi:YHS domain-containing protein